MFPTGGFMETCYQSRSVLRSTADKEINIIEIWSVCKLSLKYHCVATGSLYLFIIAKRSNSGTALDYTSCMLCARSIRLCACYGITLQYTGNTATLPFKCASERSLRGINVVGACSCWATAVLHIERRISRTRMVSCYGG